MFHGISHLVCCCRPCIWISIGNSEAETITGVHFVPLHWIEAAPMHITFIEYIVMCTAQLYGKKRRRGEQKNTRLNWSWNIWNESHLLRFSSYYYETKVGLRHFKMSNENKNLSALPDSVRTRYCCICQLCVNMNVNIIYFHSLCIAESRRWQKPRQTFTP